MLTVSINGRLVEPEHASIPVNDHGFLYGDGVFEGLRFYGKRILKASEHLDRLWDSARAIALTIPVTREAMLISLRDLVTAFPSEDGYIRVIVTRGTGALGIDLRTALVRRVPLGPDGSADVPLQLPPTVAAAGAHLHVQGLLLDAAGSVVASTNTWLLRWE